MNNIQTEWRTVKFGELVEGVRGVSYQPHQLLNDYSSNAAILLRANNIQNGRLKFDDVQLVPKSIVKATQFLKPGDISVCMSNGSKHLVGKSAQYMDELAVDCTVGAFCSIFRAKPGVDQNYIKQLFHSATYQAHIDFSLSGSAINNLKNSDIESIEFFVPTRKAQQKIAHILQTIDRAIEHTAALIEKYRQIKAGLMHDLFTRGIGADGKLRPLREQAPHLYKETPIGWIPKEWDCGTLGAIINPLRPIVYGILMPGYGYEGGVPVVKVKDIKDRKIDINNLLLTSPKIDDEYRRSRLKKNDILLTIRGTVGRVSLVPNELENANITQDTARIDITKSDSLFYSFYLETDMPVRFMAINTLGVAVQGINLGEVRKIPVIIPEISEQNKISERIFSAHQKLDAENKTLEKLEKQKIGLMHDLLTGKVPVTVSDDTPENEQTTRAAVNE